MEQSNLKSPFSSLGWNMGPLVVWPLSTNDNSNRVVARYPASLPAEYGHMTIFSPMKRKRKEWAPLPGLGLKAMGMCFPIPFPSFKLNWSNQNLTLTMQTRIMLMVEQQKRKAWDHEWFCGAELPLQLCHSPWASEWKRGTLQSSKLLYFIVPVL